MIVDMFIELWFFHLDDIYVVTDSKSLNLVVIKLPLFP